MPWAWGSSVTVNSHLSPVKGDHITKFLSQLVCLPIRYVFTHHVSLLGNINTASACLTYRFLFLLKIYKPNRAYLIILQSSKVTHFPSVSNKAMPWRQKEVRGRRTSLKEALRDTTGNNGLPYLNSNLHQPTARHLWNCDIWIWSIIWYQKITVTS